MKILFFILFFHFVLYSKAQVLTYTKEDFPGCPENSQCSKETGAKREKFNDALKLFSKKEISSNEFSAKMLEKDAFPFSVFAKKEALTKLDLALWESQCKQHKLGQIYFQGEIFVKKLNLEELKNSGVVINPVLIDRNGKHVLLPGLKGEYPILLRGDKILESIYLREEDGIYYFFSVDEKGNMKILDRPKELISAESIECSKEIKESFLKQVENTTFYDGIICKKIYHLTKKSWFPIVYGVPCY